MKNIFLIVLIMNNTILCVQDPLSQLAAKYGTDKGLAWHAYTPVYDFYFSGYRTQPIKFLEIGFQYGRSARMWQDYFSRAQLYFMDIEQEFFDKYAKDLSNRCHPFVVDQSNAEELRQFIKTVGGNFDIIIDDGGHTMEQQLVTFQELFPYVKDGGIYVVEDLHTSYWKQFGGHGTADNPQAGEGTMIQFLKDLLDELNFVGAKTKSANKDLCPAKIREQLTYYQKTIRSMHFYDSLCIIIKKEMR